MYATWPVYYVGAPVVVRPTTLPKEPIYWGFGAQRRPGTWKDKDYRSVLHGPFSSHTRSRTLAGSPTRLVIGSGVIGLAVADALARRRVNVTVIDTRAPGGGASQASAGILAPYTEADDGSPLLGLAARSLSLFDEFIRSATRAERPAHRLRALRHPRSRFRRAREPTAERIHDVARADAASPANGSKLVSSSRGTRRGAGSARRADDSRTRARRRVIADHALVNSARRAGAMFVTPAEAVRLDA